MKTAPEIQAIHGFTLIELIMVIVILGILALGTTRYIVQTTEQYTQSADRAKLIAGGRLAVEKVTRRLRNALPNSIRISGNGHCVEYFPILAGSSTIGMVSPAINSLSTASFELNSSPTNYAVIAAFDSSELYLSSLPSPGVIVETSLSTSGTKTAIPLDSTHTFLRTSPTERVYVVGRPERFCVSANALTYYIRYGIPNILSESSPSGTSTLISENIDASGLNNTFQYQAGTLERNAVVQITLNMIRSGDPVVITHQVQVRNVP